MTGDHEDRSLIEVRWHDDVSVIILRAEQDSDTVELYLGPDEARAVGQTLIRAADVERHTGPTGTGPGEEVSVRFTTRHRSDSPPTASSPPPRSHGPQ